MNAQDQETQLDTQALIDQMSEAIAELETEVAGLRVKEDELTRLQNARAALDVSAPLPQLEDERAGGVSDERYMAVLDYLREHPHSRQADIAKAVDLNAGSVSVALRRMEEEGRVKQQGIIRRSNFWELLDRENRVIPGQGVEPGRRIAGKRS